MIERIQDLPAGIDGLNATGNISRDDYLSVIDPLLERAHREGRRVRLLYRFGAEFEGFSAGAAWEDMRVGLHYLRLLERAAVVTDIAWLREGVRLAGALLPCPMRVFSVAAEADAIAWLSEPEAGARISHHLLPERGVLVMEPHGPLRQEDFDALALTVDPWIESYGELAGLVINTKGIPGWENIGALIRHLRFVRDHHTRIRRVALVADGKLFDVAPRLLEHFLHAELRHFPHDQLREATEWAGEPQP
ncbi:MAG: STAS/SEC14 domain-containing protein [Myxococcales bacterium]|nr:STAS/SEC14 domain-containing protein [Myxococcales bacterium]MCB9706584.1 STAS/SEC14 domain-containing protein [Myxococcales bacterium]